MLLIKKRSSLRYRRQSWNSLEFRKFRSHIVKLCNEECRAARTPGLFIARRNRLKAVAFCKAKWGQVPPALEAKKLPSMYELFASAGWKQWAVR